MATAQKCTTLVVFALLAEAATTSISVGGGGEACRQAAEAAAFGTQPKFVAAKASPWPVGPMAGRPVVGDVNSDGHADIVVACGTCCGSQPDPNSGHICTLLGDGTGMFKAAAGSPIKVGPSVRKLALGDINGDKALDIVAAEHDSHDLTVLMGDGTGKFTKRAGSGGSAPCVMNGPIKNPADGSMGMPRAHTHEVTLADVNADGRVDILATTVSGHGVASLLNSTDGSFAHAAGSPFRMRTPYDAIATGDMNGDGKIDIVIPSIAGSEIDIMLGDGQGAFAQAPGSPFKIGERPGYVAVGDCNGDGRLDVFATHDDVAIVDILLNDGTGQLAPAPGSPIQVKTDGFFWGIAPADFNADGHLDLALGNAATNQVTLLLGNGKGAFKPSETDIRTGNGAGYVTAADVNADGRIDLITGNYNSGDVTILLATDK